MPEHQPGLEELLQLLRANLCPLETISEDTLLAELEMDSIERTAFVLDLEEKLRVVATDEACAKWQTIGDLMSYITQYQEQSMGLILPGEHQSGEAEREPDSPR